MNYAFQDKQNLYMVLDLHTGGDMRYYLLREGPLNEVQLKFVIACVIQGLECLHMKGIIHRDLKPENLLVDSDGYVKITDLGVARCIVKSSLKDAVPVTSGTPGYMRTLF